VIVFDLACRDGHVFEAWFGSQADYEGQTARGLLSCPSCGDGEIAKAPMAPRIASGVSRPVGREPEARDVATPARPGAPAAPSAEQVAMMRALYVAQTEMLARSEDVGARFADEARAIHEGEAETRLIHGQASRAEAKGLIADGVPVAPLPFPVRDKRRDN
jgi:hypothetical protein